MFKNKVSSKVKNKVEGKICPILQRHINEYNEKSLHFSLEENETIINFISIDYDNRRIKRSRFAWKIRPNRSSIPYLSLYHLLDLLRRETPFSIHNECLHRFDFWIRKLKRYFKGAWLDELVAFSQFLHEYDNDKYRGDKGTIVRLEFKEKYLMDWYNTVMELQARPNCSAAISEQALKERFELFEKNLKDIENRIMEVKTALKLRAELASFEFDISSPTTIIRKKDTKVGWLEGRDIKEAKKDRKG